MIYAGIGSRRTPQYVLEQMYNLAYRFADSGFTLRSGRAMGADTAFEMGHKAASGAANLELFTPDQAISIWYQHAARYHPDWGKCDGRASALHARNSAIMLGKDLINTVDFVICYTLDGRSSGGTGQALRIADHLKIPTFNLHYPSAMERLYKLVQHAI